MEEENSDLMSEWCFFYYYYYFQPWNNFKIIFPFWFSLTCLLPQPDIEKPNNIKLQKTMLSLNFPSSQPYLWGIKRKWSLSCSQETRKVTICQHHLMSVILLVSSGRSQTHVPRGQSVIQTAASNTTQASGQKTAVSTSQPNHLTDYTDLAVLETDWIDYKRWYKVVFTTTGISSVQNKLKLILMTHIDQGCCNLVKFKSISFSSYWDSWHVLVLFFTSEVYSHASSCARLRY